MLVTKKKKNHQNYWLCWNTIMLLSFVMSVLIYVLLEHTLFMKDIFRSYILKCNYKQPSLTQVF